MDSGLLSLAHVKEALGSGSNAVVVSAVFHSTPSSSSRTTSGNNESTLSSLSSSPPTSSSDSNTAAISTNSILQKVPIGRRVALKIVSHFWDDNAKKLLDCERRTLDHLPSHPSLINVYNECISSIPSHIVPFLTPDMQSAVRNTTTGSSSSSSSSTSSSTKPSTTQCFVMEYHPITLDALRLMYPCPIPWYILYKISYDLLSIMHHLQTYRVGHLDLKLDNILMSIAGNCVLADFGISRIFDVNHTSMKNNGIDSDNMSLVYKEPLGLLMNRLVLAPEVLQHYDHAKSAWKKYKRSKEQHLKTVSTDPSSSSSSSSSSTSTASTNPLLMDIPGIDMKKLTQDLLINFSAQGIWSIGTILYELTNGYAHEPSYPDDGGGMRNLWYSIHNLPPIPLHQQSVQQYFAPDNNSEVTSAERNPLSVVSVPTYYTALCKQRNRSVAAFGSNVSPLTDETDPENVESSMDNRKNRTESMNPSTPKNLKQIKIHRRTPRMNESKSLSFSTTTTTTGSSSSLEFSQTQSFASIGTTDGLYMTKHGSLRQISKHGYPVAFAGLIMSMLESDPNRRISIDQALMIIQALQPRYVHRLPVPYSNSSTVRTVYLPDGTPFPLVSSIVAVELETDGSSVQVDEDSITPEGTSLMNGTPLIPVLLRHTSGVCRIVRVIPALSTELLIHCWTVGEPVWITGPDETILQDPTYVPVDHNPNGLDRKSTNTPVENPPYPEPHEDYITISRTFLGGLEIRGHETVASLIRSLVPVTPGYPPGAVFPTNESEEDDTWSDDGEENSKNIAARKKLRKDSSIYEHEIGENDSTYNQFSWRGKLTKEMISNALTTTGGILVLDLIPREEKIVCENAEYQLSIVQNICEGVSDIVGKGLLEIPVNGVLHEEVPSYVKYTPPLLPPPSPLFVWGEQRNNLLLHVPDSCYPSTHLPTNNGNNTNDSQSKVVPNTSRTFHDIYHWCTSYIQDNEHISPTLPKENTSLPIIVRSRPVTVDLREAVLYRTMLALTGLSNTALKESSTPFPYIPCAVYAARAIAWYTSRHETVSAGVGLLRNVSCIDEADQAIAMVKSGALAACAIGYFGEWKLHTDLDNEDQRLDILPREEKDDLSLIVNTTTPTSPVSSPSSPTAAVSSSTTSGPRIHGRDPRTAEDSILAASNLLRFEEIQLSSLVYAKPLCRMVIDAMANTTGTSSSAESMQLSCIRLMRYLVNIDGYVKSHHTDNDTDSILEQEDEKIFITDTKGKQKLVSVTLCSLGAIKILTNTILTFPGKRNIVENALHVICTLLVDNESRKSSICPYKLCAETTIKILLRSEYTQDTAVLGLGAIVLRNLACVMYDEVPPPSVPSMLHNGLVDNTGSTASIVGAGPSLAIVLNHSPAFVVTQVGAAAVLEDIMSRFPDDATIQENGRCALYNLLLLGSNDTKDFIDKAAAIERENENLRQKLRAISLVQAVRNGPERPSNTLLLDSPRRTNSNPLLLHTPSGRSLGRIVETHMDDTTLGGGITTTTTTTGKRSPSMHISGGTNGNSFDNQAVPVSSSSRMHSTNSSLGDHDLHLEDVHISIDTINNKPTTVVPPMVSPSKNGKNTNNNNNDSIVRINTPNNIPDWNERNEDTNSVASSAASPHCVRTQCTPAFWIMFVLFLVMVGTTIAGYMLAEQRKRKG